MGFLGKILSSTIKVALLPLAVAEDVVNVIKCEDTDSTTIALTENAVYDLGEALDDLSEGKIL